MTRPAESQSPVLVHESSLPSEVSEDRAAGA